MQRTSAKQSQFAAMPWGTEPQRQTTRAPRKTKPILEGIGVQGSGVSSPTPDPRPLTPVLSCETKPISAGAKLKLSRLQEKRYVVCSRLIGSEKQSQFPAGTGWGVAWGTRGVGCCTNKPNSCHYVDPEIGVPGRANCAKQTQFLDCGLGTDFRQAANRAKRTQLSPPAEEVGLPTPNPFAGAQGRLHEEPAAARLTRSQGNRKVPTIGAGQAATGWQRQGRRSWRWSCVRGIRHRQAPKTPLDAAIPCA